MVTYTSKPAVTVKDMPSIAEYSAFLSCCLKESPLNFVVTQLRWYFEGIGDPAHLKKVLSDMEEANREIFKAGIAMFEDLVLDDYAHWERLVEGRENEFWTSVPTRREVEIRVWRITSLM